MLGSRGLSALGGLIFGSTSRYVVENAVCDVLVVKKETFPSEQHDNKRTVIPHFPFRMEILLIWILD